jgi:hypothetical protein
MEIHALHGDAGHCGRHRRGGKSDLWRVQCSVDGTIVAGDRGTGWIAPRPGLAWRSAIRIYPAVVSVPAPKRAIIGHRAAFASMGNVKMNVAPCGSFFSVHSRPPCDSTIDRQIANPMPIPSRFRREERLEHPVGHLDAWAAVADFDPHRVNRPLHAHPENFVVRDGVHRLHCRCARG